jgi:uncharacterized repeat protein (TIGR03809 family)
MTYRTDVARGRDVVARWCALAEQRLEYLTELFETGRWRRYHSERAFLENIQEAKIAVEIWRDLSTSEAARENFAVDVSWLGRPRTTLPRDIWPSHGHRFKPQRPPIPAELPRPDLSISVQTRQLAAAEASPAPHSKEPAMASIPEPVSQAALEPALQPALEPVLEPVMARVGPIMEKLTRDIATVTVTDRYPLLRNVM